VAGIELPETLLKMTPDGASSNGELVSSKGDDTTSTAS